MSEALWVEKYRPRKISDTVLPAELKEMFQEFVNKGSVPNLLLAGGPGIGKTTVAKAMLEEIGSPYIMINGSNEGRLIETLRTTITNYASSKSLTGGRKTVIIDEAEYMNIDSVQPALRSFIEEFHTNCGFIMTCNFENKIIEALKSRNPVIRFDVKKEDREDMAAGIYKRCKYILTEENVEFDNKVLAEVVKKFFPDFRRTIGELQRYSARGKIDSGILSDVIEVKFEDLVSAMAKKEFTVVRKWVGENLDNDFDRLVRHIYDTVEAKSIPQMVLTLADYSYKNAFVADREINTMAMLTELMMEIEFK